MSSRIHAAVFAALLLFASNAALAQNFVFPGKFAGTPCTGCGGTNEGVLTYPYAPPLVKHTGRYVDSSTTLNVQHVGMRTVRANAIRVAPATGRIYVELGETVGGYDLGKFFSTRLSEPMVLVSTMNTGSTYSRYGYPLEKIAAVDSFFYAEATQSGWTTSFGDYQVYLDDFDVDDRGYVYVGTARFGWGVARDVGLTGSAHMEFVSQIQDSPVSSRDGVFVFRNGTTYYAAMAGVQSSTGAAAYALYDVTTPATPTLLATRTGTQNGVRAWARYEAGSRLAFVNADGHVRIYSNSGFAAGSAPLADFTPATGKSFKNVAFDADGVLWVTESGGTTSASFLRKFTPTGNAYTNETLDVFGGIFAVDKLDAAGGYIAVAGRSAVNGATKYELRLFVVENGVPRLLDTEDFFRRFYHQPPAGFIDLSQFMRFSVYFDDVRLVTQGQTTYLMYSAMGLGDVFELGAPAPRLETTLTLSTTPNPGVAGNNVTLNAVLTPAGSVDALPSGTVRFKAGTTILGTGTLVADGRSFRASYTHSGFAAGSHLLSADFAGDAHYRTAVSPAHTHISCAPAAITRQPASPLIFTGQSAKLVVRATGSATIAYQWYRGRTGSTTDPIAGATTSAFDTADAGEYWVRVANGCGTADSATATVTVHPVPPVPAGAQKAFDFNGDDRADILWRYYTTGRNTLWIMNGATRTAADTAPISDPKWKTGAIGDFNLDGQADLFWRNGSTGENTVWLMNGATRLSATPQTTVATNVVLAGSGDFDGNGTADLLWRNLSNGANSIWFMSGATPSVVSIATVSDQRWIPSAFGDFNGDGIDDIFWRNKNTGTVSVWLMNGTAFTSTPVGTVRNLYMAPRGAADFNGDGRDDIMWRDESTGKNAIWFMNGTTATAANLPTAGAMWRPVAFGDFDGNGTGDIVWRNMNSGEIRSWLMNGAAIVTNAVITSISDTAWTVEEAK